MQKMQEMEQVGGSPNDRNTLNKLMTLNPGLNNGSMNSNNQHLVGRGPLTGSAQAALALTNYQNMLMRQNSMSSPHNNSNSSLHQEASSPFATSSHTPSTPGPSAALQGNNYQNSPVTGFSSGQSSSQRQQMAQNGNGNNGLSQQQQSMHSQGSQALQQQMIQQLLQDMSNKNNGTAPPQQNQGGNMSRESVGFRSSPTVSGAGNNNNSSVGRAPSRSNSFNTSNAEPPAPAGNMRFNEKTSDLSQNLHLSDDVAHEFSENGFFNSDLDDNMNFDWKA